MKIALLGMALVVSMGMGMGRSSPEQSFSSADVQRIYTRIVVSTATQNAPPISVEKGDVNAYYDGRHIAVYTGMLQFVRNEDELALVIGHELAHIKWRSETKADEVGANYIAIAGYNRCKGALMLKRLGKGDSVHPSGTIRYKHLGCK